MTVDICKVTDGVTNMDLVILSSASWKFYSNNITVLFGGEMYAV